MLLVGELPDDQRLAQSPGERRDYQRDRLYGVGRESLTDIRALDFNDWPSGNTKV